MPLAPLLNQGAPPTTTRLDLTSEWKTHALTRLTLESQWKTHVLTRLTLESEWRTRTLTRLTLESQWKTHVHWRLDLVSEWKTRTAKTQLGLLSEWCTRRILLPQTVRLDLESRWRTLRAPQAVRLNLTGSWKTHALTRLTLESEWKTVAASHVRLILDSEWQTKALTRLTLAGSWQTAGMLSGTTEVYPMLQLNGIPLRLFGPMDPGGEPSIYDEIRHYDGSLVIHDVRTGTYERGIPIMLTDTTPSGLDAQEAAIRTACKAGGTVAWQSVGPGGALGTLETDTFIASDKPSFLRDKTRTALLRSYATLRLKMMPS